MSAQELTALLDRLRSEPNGTAWLEFKENHHEAQDLGEHLSALANAAYLAGKTGVANNEEARHLTKENHV